MREGFPTMSPETKVSATELAKRLMVSPNSIQNFIKAGMPGKNGHGKSSYYVWEIVFPWYLARIQHEALRSATAATTKAKLDGAYESARKCRAEADRHELKLAKERGEVVLTKDVRRAAEVVFGNFRSRAMSVPMKLARRLGACKTDAQRKDVIEKEMREMLNELVMTAVPAERFEAEPEVSPAGPATVRTCSVADVERGM
jgi:phage terminase Nu1 subunit (DNA packaging protein)